MIADAKIVSDYDAFPSFRIDKISEHGASEGGDAPPQEVIAGQPSLVNEESPSRFAGLTIIRLPTAPFDKLDELRAEEEPTVFADLTLVRLPPPRNVDEEWPR
jgi:hypothetical protein